MPEEDWVCERERERRSIVWGQKSVASKWKQCNQNTMKKSVQREIKQTPVAESDSRGMKAVIYFEIFWLLLKINDLKFKAFGSNLVYENNINFWTSLFFNLILHLHISFSHVFIFAFYHSSEKISLAKFSEKIEK